VANDSHALPEGVSAQGQGGPEFVGQQAGEAAELLHAELRTALVGLPQIDRAYFCRLRYLGEEQVRAAVCVASSAGEDMRVVEVLAAVIQANLDRASYVDILFLSPSLEARLSRVCQVFYERAKSDGEA
jgi:hypothetical protein